MSTPASRLAAAGGRAEHTPAGLVGVCLGRQGEQEILVLLHTAPTPPTVWCTVQIYVDIIMLFLLFLNIVGIAQS